MIDMVKVDSYMQRYIPTSNTLGVSKNKDNSSQHVYSCRMPDVMSILYRDVLYASTIVLTLMSMDMIITWIILKDSNNSNLLNFYVRK